MAENTKIQWADFTFNHVRGCTKVAAGCANCYAETMSRRNPSVLGIWGDDGSRVVASEAMWREPVKWDREAQFAEEYNAARVDVGKPVYRRPRVFCASLADVFEDWAGPVVDSKGRRLWISTRGTEPWEFDNGAPGFAFEKRHGTLEDVRLRLFALIDSTQNLDWLLLTKRPENVRRMWPSRYYSSKKNSKPFRNNVWLGTSISTQADADRNIPLLLQCRDLAAKLFVSAEPLVGPIELEANKMGVRPWHDEPWFGGIDLVIVGGESGPNARPCNVDWVRDLIRQCRAAKVPCFVKQLGTNVCQTDHQGAPARIRLRDPKGGNPDEWSEELRVREVPD